MLPLANGRAARRPVSPPARGRVRRENVVQLKLVNGENRRFLARNWLEISLNRVFSSCFSRFCTTSGGNIPKRQSRPAPRSPEAPPPFHAGILDARLLALAASRALARKRAADRSSRPDARAGCARNRDDAIGDDAAFMGRLFHFIRVDRNNCRRI
jgi:hypothetical protein